MLLRQKSSWLKKRPLYSTSTSSENYDYDVFVIGGGSGGLAFAKEAAKLGKKVGLCDFVKPSPLQQSTWGLGGTCVNVGCIPKKLMHQSGIVKESMDNSAPFGWTAGTTTKEVDWDGLVNSVQNYIKSLNFGYKNDLLSNDVTYLNHLATFQDIETVTTTGKKAGVGKTIRARNFVIAVGGRPTIPYDVEGVEYAITSDDLFSMKKSPGKTLIVGASYIALECAGFLHKFGYDTSVMVRSIVLRGFDVQIAGLIENHMRESGINFIGPSVPTKIEKLEDGKLKVYYTKADNTVGTDIFDTVMFAIGRSPDVQKLSLDKVGVQLAKSGKIRINDEEQTSTPNIYALGDCAQGVPELTPVAIRSGVLLARRLAGVSEEKMNYKTIPTTVFTPIEYGTVGLSEEEAEIIYGSAQIEVYHTFFQPLETVFDKSMENKCYVKLICNKLENERIIGFHLYSPNAGEITQGFATAMICGATKKDFEKTIGIHPTIGEEAILLKTTKRESANPIKSGC